MLVDAEDGTAEDGGGDPLLDLLLLAALPTGDGRRPGSDRQLMRGRLGTGQPRRGLAVEPASADSWPAELATIRAAGSQADRVPAPGRCQITTSAVTGALFPATRRRPVSDHRTGADPCETGALRSHARRYPARASLGTVPARVGTTIAARPAARTAARTERSVVQRARRLQSGRAADGARQAPAHGRGDAAPNRCPRTGEGR